MRGPGKIVAVCLCASLTFAAPARELADEPKPLAELSLGGGALSLVSAGVNLYYLIKGERAPELVFIASAVLSIGSIFAGGMTLATPYIEEAGPIICLWEPCGADARRYKTKYLAFGGAALASGVLGVIFAFSAWLQPAHKPAPVADAPRWSVAPVVVHTLEGPAMGAGLSMVW